MKSAPRPSVYDYAAWILSALSMLFILQFHLLPTLIAGLLVYQLVRLLHPFFSRRLSSRRARGVTLGVVTLLVIGLISAIGFGIQAFMNSEGGSVSGLLAKMADIIENSRLSLPPWLADAIPGNTQILSEKIGEWLRRHAMDLQRLGAETGHSLAHMLIGMVIGAMVSLRDAIRNGGEGPLARALAGQIRHMGEAFRRVVFAQVRISALNTLFTAFYLAAALPLFGVSLPLTKTMIVVTFITGLLPVIGNLFSNMVIFVVSLAHSPPVALASLGFLVLIHKLEYFLNARIVGSQINACAWELLTAMLFMESIYGLPGLVAAPVCYAWLKSELRSRELI